MYSRVLKNSQNKNQKVNSSWNYFLPAYRIPGYNQQLVDSLSNVRRALFAI
jgi:hypothetical protein